MVTRNFPPLTGGMERLNHQVYHALSHQYKVSICGPEGAGGFAEKDTPIAESPLSPLSRYLLHVQWQALRMSWRVRPEIVYSGSGLTAPAALMAGKVVGAKTICFLHGLDIVASHAVYRHIFLPAIRRFDRILVNSQHTANLAQQAGIKIEKISIVHPGTELPEWDERENARLRFKEKFGLENRQLLLSAGRLTQRKGVAEFIRHVLPGIANRFPRIMLLVIGEEPKNALRHIQGVTDDIKKAIRETGLDDHVILLGRVDEKCLSDAYFACDIMIFPALELPGDVEGFGMVAIEAAAHGLPTLGFAVGGIPDAVAEGISGCLLPFGEYASLSEQIIGKLEAGIANSWSRQCREHAEKFEWKIFRQRFLAACQA